MTTLFVVIVLALILFNRHIDKKISNLNTLKEEVGSFEKNTESVFLRKEIEDNKEKIDKVTSLFVQKEREIDFLEEIEELGRANSVLVEIKDVKIEDVNKKKKIEKEDGSVEAVDYRAHGVVIVAFVIEGSKQSIISFVEALENIERGVKLNDLRIQEDSELGIWRGMFNINGLSL